ncbi:asparagine synthase (glutamine-hydrolyzing) [Campylobacter hyointestinalis]|uniref:asparagine synthase (glutamine-hydrolyzing) n=1 Tax=Campylobacter hyointestinalis TaxID=198 RepID=UPI000DCBEEEF|nr:asparagine synthase (glutamine-hydrolyzing) [Campylobacter hyointestinalis]RAZ45682.1 asparagine synthase (glutamine-hydrolyzing) [Campylobacter hyointestinalis subsp. lawsonii]TWO19352.1 asparagine synthase (glutamine-hydrolyzing) [Campylobacter hyointestinalis]
MCGIMGFNFQTNHPGLLRLLHHRGPDNASKVEFDKFTLIHNRLSIVDHNSKSNQPFKSSCGRYTIVFNGEIYNYKELKNKLKNEHDFITDSDTEVLLYLYIKYDKECLKYLRGMFAFAIYDKVKDRLFCARDRVGIKPFIYYFKDGKFIFGSELNSIFSLLDTKPKINQESILQYLKYLYIPYPNTIFEHIYKLSPAHILIYENKSIKIEKYWDSDSFIGKNNGLTESEILCKLDILFNESIKLQMISDVELGSFLSGGIDSSLILYYMQKNSEKPINTFTLGFKNAKNYDETSDAKIMADFFNTNHTEIIIEPQVLDLLPKMIKHFGEPFASPTALLIHELTKETKKYATVALAGDGGDEIFGGYPKYQALKISEALSFIPPEVFNLLSKLTNRIPESTSGNHLPRRIKKFISSMSKGYSDKYDDWSSYINDDDLSLLCKDYTPYKHIVKYVWENEKECDCLIKSSIVDLKAYLPNDMLYYGDIMSMANSFEVRFPLIDHKIIEFMTSIDSKWRIKNGQTKYLMRKLLTGKIPDSIINKKKLGLNPPIGIWLKNDLRILISNYLSKEIIEKRGLFEYGFIQQMIYEFDNNIKDRSLNIWALIVLEEWFRQYVDN